MSFQNYGLPKTQLDQRLKTPVSEYPSKSKMANSSKHCSHLKRIPFTTFIDHWEANCPTTSLY